MYVLLKQQQICLFFLARCVLFAAHQLYNAILNAVYLKQNLTHYHINKKSLQQCLRHRKEKKKQRSVLISSSRYYILLCNDMCGFIENAAAASWTTA